MDFGVENVLCNSLGLVKGFSLYLRLSNKDWGWVPCTYCVYCVFKSPYIICSKCYCSVYVVLAETKSGT